MKVNDFRHITNGWEIPTEYYSDQPYIVKADDGAWVCTITTGPGVEGQHGQHIIITRSTDMGKTWSKPVALEPSDGPEASYSVLLKVPYGRIYCFYNHNTDNTRELIADKSEWSPAGVYYRVDSQGHFVFKYSDDNGITWSDKRYEIPVRETEIDRTNPYKGKIKFFWNVGKAFMRENSGYVPLHKVGRLGEGFFASSEGVLFRSDNIASERDPEKITWEMLPDGEIGIRSPAGGGPVSEEHSFSVLSDGSIYCVYRTIDGSPAETYSRDGGHTWSTPEYKKYANGRVMRHPRAANFAWKCENGKFIYWYHNNGTSWYEERNPVWASGGIEADGPDGRIIKWTQPEILLYDDDSFVRISYPDMIEDGGKYFVSETEKDVARVHEIPNEFLEKLWSQFEIKEVCKRKLVFESDDAGKGFQMPLLTPFLIRNNEDPAYRGKDMRSGFTLEFWLGADAAGTLLDTRSPYGNGILVEITDGRVKITLSDGRTENSWSCDKGALKKGEDNHIVIIVDGGPKIISYVINGVLNDGDGKRPFGFGRFSRDLHDAAGTEGTCFARPSKGQLVKPPAKASGAIKKLRIYDAALMATEAIGNYKAGI